MPADLILDAPAITRSQLYDLVWQHETEALAAACRISGSLLGRVCRRWMIPKPGRGQWQQMLSGQRVKRSPLPPWPGTDGDPDVLTRNTAGGYGTTVPRKVRPPRPKEDRLAKVLKELQGKRRAEDEAEERRNAKLFDLLGGPATRHVLAVEGWHVEHDTNLALRPALAFEDLSTIRLDCRYVLPFRPRRGAVQIEMHFRWQREGAGHGRIPEVIGYVRRGRRRVDLWLAEDKAGFICSALAAGRVRVVDLEVVKDGSRDVIRWARLCTRTHDGVGEAPRTVIG